MATKKTTRRASPSRKRAARRKPNGGAFPAMSELMKAIEENFRMLAAMVPAGGSARPKRRTKFKTKAKSKRATSRAGAAVKRAAAKGKRSVARSKKAVRKTVPKKSAAKRSHRADKRPSATAPV